MGGLKKKVEGTGKEIMGKAQKGAGKAIGDPGMQARGTEKEVAGHAEKKLGDVQGKVAHKKPGQHKAHGRH
jgi:uncharacterized protein YjbJ (UPF0337 family)